LLHAVVSVLLLAGVPDAAPARVLPREDAERDGRRTLGDISRAVNNLDRNPTRLLFGAGNSNAAPAPAPAPTPAAAATERKRQ
jgi:hypothetical protein